jgi:ribosomal protein S18 acetylase RimI-like enzyme
VICGLVPRPGRGSRALNRRDKESGIRLTSGIEIKIRKAELADAALIADFNIKLAAESEGLRLDPACVAQGVRALLLDPAKGVYFLAEIDGAVVGQLMVTYEWSDWRNANIWWIQSVYVREEARGKGVFRWLFNHLQSAAGEQKGVCSLRLYVHSENAAARRTYEKLGMKRMSYEVYESGLKGEP